MRDAKPIYEGEAVKLLGRFLFRYEQVREPVTSLSGGERTRLQLLLLMLREPNCLVLDEPTNHLDIDSLEILEDELERFRHGDLRLARPLLSRPYRRRHRRGQRRRSAPHGRLQRLAPFSISARCLWQLVTRRLRLVRFGLCRPSLSACQQGPAHAKAEMLTSRLAKPGDELTSGARAEGAGRQAAGFPGVS